jgi:hypothetical protein
VRGDAESWAIWGETSVAVALFIGGLLGVASSIGQIRTGRRSRPLQIAMTVIFLAAIGTMVVSASKIQF